MVTSKRLRPKSVTRIHSGLESGDRETLEALLVGALARFDVVLLSGGTSKGGGDLTYRGAGVDVGAADRLVARIAGLAAIQPEAVARPVGNEAQAQPQ